MERYLEEGLIALVPVYTSSDRALVVTSKAEHSEGRTVPWLIEKLANHYSMNINKLRQRYGDMLHVKKHVTIPINEDIVMIPVKTRTAICPGETTVGYCNLLQVDHVCDEEDPGSEALSIIVCRSGYKLKTLNTAETLRDKIRQGEQVRQDFVKLRANQGPAYAGLSAHDIIFPNCDCILLDMFRSMLHLKDDDV